MHNTVVVTHSIIKKTIITHLKFEILKSDFSILCFLQLNDRNSVLQILRRDCFPLYAKRLLEITS